MKEEKEKEKEKRKTKEKRKRRKKEKENVISLSKLWANSLQSKWSGNTHTHKFTNVIQNDRIR